MFHSEINNISIKDINEIEKQYILEQMTSKVKYVVGLISNIIGSNIEYEYKNHFECENTSYNGKNNCFTTINCIAKEYNWLPFITIFYDNDNIDYELDIEHGDGECNFITNTITKGDLKTNLFMAINNSYVEYHNNIC